MENLAFSMFFNIFIRTHHIIVKVGWLRLADQHDTWKAAGQDACRPVLEFASLPPPDFTTDVPTWDSIVLLSTWTIDLHQGGRQCPRLFTYYIEFIFL